MYTALQTSPSPGIQSRSVVSALLGADELPPERKEMREIEPVFNNLFQALGTWKNKGRQDCHYDSLPSFFPCLLAFSLTPNSREHATV